MDWVAILGYIVGGSGIAGWVFTYLDLRQQQHLEAKRLFHELVLTPEMLQLWGSDFDLLDLQEASIQLKAGRHSWVSLPETKGHLIRVTNEKQLQALTQKLFVRINDLTNKVSRSALTLLLPTRLKKKEGNFVRALKSCKNLDDIEKARNQLFEFGEELRKVLGVHILD